MLGTTGVAGTTVHVSVEERKLETGREGRGPEAWRSFPLRWEDLSPVRGSQDLETDVVSVSRAASSSAVLSP